MLNNKLTFIADLSDGEKAKLIECGVSTKDTGEVTERLYNLQVSRACWAFIAPFDVVWFAAVVHDILYEKINGAFKAGIMPTKKPQRTI